MPNAKVFDVPMELRLKLMSVVRADFPDPEREFFDDVINEVDRIGLGVFFIDFERPHTRRIINRGILETPYFLALLSYECQELDVLELPPESGPPTGIDYPSNWRISDGWKTRETGRDCIEASAG